MRIRRRSLIVGTIVTIAASSAMKHSRGSPAAPTGSPGMPDKPPQQLAPTEQLMHATVMIECVDKASLRSSGTGFFFSLFNQPEKNQSVPVIVSNKHVVKGAVTGFITLTIATADGTPDFANHIRVTIPNFEAQWLLHPDSAVDLAVFPCAKVLKELTDAGHQIFWRSLDESLVPTEEELRTYMPVEDVLVIGYPDGISDITNNAPVFRRGITATSPYLNFLGKKEFLVDAAIFPGSSGSPVFLFNEGTWITREATVAGGYRIKLFGIVYAVAQHSVTGEIAVVPAPTNVREIAVSAIPNNLGVCIRSSRILEFEPIFVNNGFQLPDGYKMREVGQ